MPEVYSHQLVEVVRYLFVAGFISFAWRTAREAAETNGRLEALWKGWAWCIGLALFAAATMGQPSCDETGDPLHGGCEQYSDDGYDPTFDQRLARLMFLALLFGIPVTAGVLDARRYTSHPWRKPEPKRPD